MELIVKYKRVYKRKNWTKLISALTLYVSHFNCKLAFLEKINPPAVRVWFSSRWHSRAAFQKSTVPEFFSSSTKWGSTEALQGATGLTFPNTVLKTSSLCVRYSFSSVLTFFQSCWTKILWSCSHSSQPVCVYGFVVLLERQRWFLQSESERD